MQLQVQTWCVDVVWFLDIPPFSRGTCLLFACVVWINVQEFHSVSDLFQQLPTRDIRHAVNDAK